MNKTKGGFDSHNVHTVGVPGCRENISFTLVSKPECSLVVRHLFWVQVQACSIRVTPIAGSSMRLLFLGVNRALTMERESCRWNSYLANQWVADVLAA